MSRPFPLCSTAHTLNCRRCFRQAEAKEADILAANDARTILHRETKPTDRDSDQRTLNNPLNADGFWKSPWQVKIKIMRQLVDWNRESGVFVHTESQD